MKSVFLWTTRVLSFYLVHRTNAIDVSVCLDATYPLASSQKNDICSGSGDKPLGMLCPLKGDLAVADCHPFLPSFVVGGGCVLRENAECRIITGTTWGCVLPSIGCEQQETQCPTWVATNSDETVNIDASHSIDKNEKFGENWFVQTSPVTELYNCGEKPTPTPTPAPTEAPRLMTPQPTVAALVPKTLAPSTLKPPAIEPTTALPTPEPTMSTPTMMEPRTPCPTTSKPVTPRLTTSELVTPRPTILISKTPLMATKAPVEPHRDDVALTPLPNTTEPATPCPSTTGSATTPPTASPTTCVGLRQSLHHL